MTTVRDKCLIGLFGEMDKHNGSPIKPLLDRTVDINSPLLAKLTIDEALLDAFGVRPPC